MSNLIPEVRADKDGKLVTRHVRAVTNDAASKKFPAPMGNVTSQAEADLKEVKDGLIGILNHYRNLVNEAEERDAEAELDLDDEDALWQMDDGESDELGFDPNSFIEAASIGTALEELPASTISHMRAKMESDKYSDDYEIAVLHALSFGDNDPQLMDYLTALHSEVSDLFPERDILSESDTNSYTLMVQFVQGLRNFESIGYVLPDIFNATDEERMVMHSLNFLNTEVGNDEGKADPALGRIVMDNPDRAGDIVELMITRRTKDVDVIREIIESQVPSVSSGLL